METKDPSGQRLRWWTQENTTSTTTSTTSQPTKKHWYNGPIERVVEAPPVVVPPVISAKKATAPVATAPMELWEELEAEAVRRAQLESNAVSIQGNARQIIGTTRKRWAFTVLPAILFCLAVVFAFHSWSLLGMVGFLVAEVLFLDWLVRSLYKKGAPRASFSPLGVTLEMPAYTLGPIFWDEIKEIKVRRHVYGSYLELHLKDHKSTYARALRTHGDAGKKQAWLIQKSKTVMLMDTMFSMPAKEIAAQIAKFRPDLLEQKRRR